MKLYCTPGSPYARMARIVVLEKGLGSRVEVIFAKTRTKNSPYYEVNPSGRVPYLVRDDGVGMEESALICAYLDQLDGKPTLGLPPGWEAKRLEALARSLTDGVSVWGRELYRPVAPGDDRAGQHRTDHARLRARHGGAQPGFPLARRPSAARGVVRRVRRAALVRGD